MQATRLFAAALLTLAAAGAMAQEIDSRDQRFAAAAASTRTREAVQAEARNARLAGEWLPGGDVREAVAAAPAVATTATALSRQDVKNQVAAARAARQLPRAGELM